MRKLTTILQPLLVPLAQPAPPARERARPELRVKEPKQRRVPRGSVNGGHRRVVQRGR